MRKAHIPFRKNGVEAPQLSEARIENALGAWANGESGRGSILPLRASTGVKVSRFLTYTNGANQIRKRGPRPGGVEPYLNTSVEGEH